eukprot:CAMPEP_0198200984 /NCGR_PEP_ID=MMETSP1445-20131203/3838_1 /TAXON_ID=36898 /ORGANISM="Pyramimonas sp., Strain CCMP2087" /LENGTH=383 /DNA_ID=CAMNT_0043871157 /DNA_START=399 /DNA_END=1551 /DNA_ORIENTATION=+
MARNNLGASDLVVSKVCLGTMQFGEGLSVEEGHAQMSYAYERGVNFFDTAEMYPVPQNPKSHGRSEKCLGNWMRTSGHPRDRVHVATKVTGPSAQMPWIRDGPMDAAAIMAAAEDSLLRLDTDYIDLLQLHWPDRYVPMFGDVDFDPTYDYSACVPIEEQLEALSILVAQGKVREIGLSNETPWGLMRFCQLAASGQLPRVASIQNAYNLLNRTFDSTLAECSHRENVSLLAYSPMAMGHLTGKYLNDRQGPSKARLNVYKGQYAEIESRYSFSRPNLMSAVKEYVSIAREQTDLTAVQLAMGFVMRNPLLGSVVVGATNVDQLQELIDAAVGAPLEEHVVEAVKEVHERYPNPALDFILMMMGSLSGQLGLWVDKTYWGVGR